ncbi:carbohydrate kinase [Rhodopirellula sp. SM50]|nr:FGGY-family carbohydrate kinase [Rhodopirellula sp. SM50]PAY21007.1 carbohydrate kinase [Rhodopirellula sp. SM50]
MPTNDDLFLGIDIGTSGVRSTVITQRGEPIATAIAGLPKPIEIDSRPCQDPDLWWIAACDCLSDLAKRLKLGDRNLGDVRALSVAGTSGTLLLADESLTPVSPGYLYNSAGFNREAKIIAAHAPPDSIANGPGSALARLMFLQKLNTFRPARFIFHQADWIAAKFLGGSQVQGGGLSDETNVLKMGYDVVHRRWPDWIADCGIPTRSLPHVHPVGDRFGTISDAVCKQFGFAHDVSVVAGTTDSNAAFLASGACQRGEGVTSLGTTLAIKLLSDQPVFDPSRGIYSHRIGDMWLPGGASNSGGGVLLDFFTPDQLSELQSNLDPSTPTGLDYYPLSKPGERFPIADPNLVPRLTPRPQDDAVFLQGMLESIAEIERVGYAALQELGAPKVHQISTAGGGAANDAWTQIRTRVLAVPVLNADSSEAAVGAARIAAGLI